MHPKFLTLVATIAGGMMLLALLMLPFEVMDMPGKTPDRTLHAVELPGGVLMLLAAWLATAFAMFVQFRSLLDVGLSDRTCRLLSLLAFKLAGFLWIASLFGGTRFDGDDARHGFGFWLSFPAAFVGALALYLTFNAALSKTIAKKAEEMGAGTLPLADDETADDEKPDDATPGDKTP